MRTPNHKVKIETAIGLDTGHATHTPVLHVRTCPVCPTCLHAIAVAAVAPSGVGSTHCPGEPLLSAGNWGCCIRTMRTTAQQQYSGGASVPRHKCRAEQSRDSTFGPAVCPPFRIRVRSLVVGLKPGQTHTRTLPHHRASSRSRDHTFRLPFRKVHSPTPTPILLSEHTTPGL